MWNEILAEIVTNHWGKLVGTLGGLIFGILTVSFGLLKALFIIICLVIGYIIGKRVDELGGWQKLIYRLWGDDR